MKEGAKLKKLQKRQSAWSTMKSSGVDGFSKRGYGGYRCPGSRKK